MRIWIARMGVIFVSACASVAQILKRHVKCNEVAQRGAVSLHRLPILAPEGSTQIPPYVSDMKLIAWLGRTWIEDQER